MLGKMKRYLVHQILLIFEHWERHWLPTHQGVTSGKSPNWVLATVGYRQFGFDAFLKPAAISSGSILPVGQPLAVETLWWFSDVEKVLQRKWKRNVACSSSRRQASNLTFVTKRFVSKIPRDGSMKSQRIYGRIYRNILNRCFDPVKCSMQPHLHPICNPDKKFECPLAKWAEAAWHCDAHKLLRWNVRTKHFASDTVEVASPCCTNHETFCFGLSFERDCWTEPNANHLFGA